MRPKNYLPLQIDIDSEFFSILDKFVCEKEPWERSLALHDYNNHAALEMDTSEAVRNTGTFKTMKMIFGGDILFRIFMARPNSWTGVHRDLSSAKSSEVQLRACAVNVPIKNVENSFQTWYDNSAPLAKRLESIGADLPSNAYDPSVWKPIDSLELKLPALVRTDVWHNIDNRLNPKARWIVSFRSARGNPPFETIAARCSSFSQ